ncbi:MAG: amidohydrolase [Bacteroidota bacterium]
MLQDLRITLIQSPLHWEDIPANLAAFGERLQRISPGSTDLIVLPETFTTGFSMHTPELAEDETGPSLAWMRVMASEKRAVVTGSLIFREGERYFNRLLWVRPDGTHAHYDKRHCFTLAGEHEHFSPGRERLVVDCRGWRICPLICYDLRFPVWSRYRGDYDALLYIANWPSARSAAWRTLLRGRAIENQCYVLGVNRVGTDEKGLYYSGDSAVIDYAGETLYELRHLEGQISLQISAEAQQNFRKKLAFLADRDEFEWKV